MADHVYKFREVPKGQRWNFFWDYYKIPVAVTIISVIALVSILKTTVFAPKKDIVIVTATETYVLPEVWSAVEEQLCLMPFDFNEDGKVLAELNVNHIDPKLQETDPETFMAIQAKLTASLSTAESALQIVDEKTVSFFREQALLGTYAEMPAVEGHAPEEELIIPLKELTPFKNVEGLPDGLFMILRPEDAMQIYGSEKKLANYKKQTDALFMMMQP